MTQTKLEPRFTKLTENAFIFISSPDYKNLNENEMRTKIYNITVYVTINRKECSGIVMVSVTKN